MLTSIKQRMDREDEGFTLIELMVVLLIIAILLAIAIPTFLGARNTANARGTQENLRNALTAEQTYWTSNQSFAQGLSSIEAALSWSSGTVATSGGNTVSANLYNLGSPTAAVTSGTADSVELLGYGKDGNCWAIFASDNPSASFTSYAMEPSVSGTGCAVITPPNSAPTTTSTATADKSGNWEPNF